MITIETGTRVLGGGYQFEVKDYYMLLLGGDKKFAEMTNGQVVIGEIPSENNPERQVTVHRFMLSETEITNLQYREFLIDSLLEPSEAAQLRAAIKAGSKNTTEGGRAAWQPLIAKAGAAGLLPDTACWKNDFQYAYNEPLVKHYHWHKAFDHYPVVGVNWNQAQAYCAWLTRTVNDEILRKNPKGILQPAYRLPTEAEWEYSALPKAPTGDASGSKYIYPWRGAYVIDEKGRYRANIKPRPGSYIDDGYEYTCPVKSFEANENGLYGMAGNVSEWCEDNFVFNSEEKNSEISPMRRPGNSLFAVEEVAPSADSEIRVVKGGSWAEFNYGAMCGSRMPFRQTQGSSRIGFRVAQIIVGSPF